MQSDKLPSQMPDGHVARMYAKVWNNLSCIDNQECTLLLLDGRRIVVPHGAKGILMKQLHAGHAGFARTKK